MVEEEASVKHVPEPVVVPEISLHAMAGTRAPQTMRVQGKVRTQPIQILVDSGEHPQFPEFTYSKEGRGISQFRRQL